MFRGYFRLFKKEFILLKYKLENFFKKLKYNF